MEVGKLIRINRGWIAMDTRHVKQEESTDESGGDEKLPLGEFKDQ
jgi:hypothetical protein